MVRVKREFSSELHQLPAMRALVVDSCRTAWGTTKQDEAICLLELALQEAASNIIRHAYQGTEGRPIELTVEADDDQARIALSHCGQDFDPDTVGPPAFDGSREGGFGLYLIRQSVDEVKFHRDDRGWCVISLVKRRQRPETSR